VAKNFLAFGEDIFGKMKGRDGILVAPFV